MQVSLIQSKGYPRHGVALDDFVEQPDAAYSIGMRHLSHFEVEIAVLILYGEG